MASTPLVYVIVLTYNGKRDTLECLRSLQNLSCPNVKVLVVDNASSDGTPEAIRAEFSSVELLVNPTNLRFAGGNNVGIRHALKHGADYVLLLNNDTTVERDFTVHLVHAAEADPRIGMIGPKIYYYDDPNRIWFAGGRIEWWKGWISHIGIRENDSGQHDEQKPVDYLTGCCMLVKRAVVEQVGLLDERYFMYGEDADWCVRARRAGYVLAYVPAAKIWHKLSVSAGGHLSWFKNWNKFKSQLRLMATYAKPYHWLSIPFGLIYGAVSGYITVKRR
jgi:hypothetical protein